MVKRVLYICMKRFIAERLNLCISIIIEQDVESTTNSQITSETTVEIDIEGSEVTVEIEGE